MQQKKIEEIEKEFKTQKDILKKELIEKSKELNKEIQNLDVKTRIQISLIKELGSMIKELALDVKKEFEEEKKCQQEKN